MNDLSNDLEAIREAMDAMSAAECDYQEWLNVGMALKDAGGTCEEWEAWSAADPMRYHAGECAKKWRGFGRTGTAAVGAGSIVKQARDKGHVVRTRPEDSALEWDAEIGDATWTTTDCSSTLPAMNLTPPQMLAKYVETLFQKDEIVGYVVDVYQPENTGGFAPKRGNYRETAGTLLGRLAECKSLAEAIGDWNEEAGAWIRFNPLDGKGVADSNVKAYRHALVESDKISPEEAFRIYKDLQLPIAALVSSAGKSLHAIVRIDAKDEKEYRERVDCLYELCKKNGLKIDRNNRNPSRLSRLPGATRRGKMQSLVAVNIGKSSWAEWQAFMAEQNEECESVSLPPLTRQAKEACRLANYITRNVEPPQWVVEDFLVRGAVTAIVGEAGIGKSLLLSQLAYCVGTGMPFLGLKTEQGAALLLDLEMPAAGMAGLKGRIAQQLDGRAVDPALPVFVINHFDETLDDLQFHVGPDVVGAKQSGTGEKVISLETFDKRFGKLLADWDLLGKLSVLIIDGATEFCDGKIDENSSIEVRALVMAFRRIALKHNIAIAFLLHTGKGDNHRKQVKDLQRGSSAWHDTSDIVHTFTRAGGGDDYLLVKLGCSKNRWAKKLSERKILRKGLSWWEPTTDNCTTGRPRLEEPDFISLFPSGTETYSKSALVDECDARGWGKKSKVSPAITRAVLQGILAKLEKKGNAEQFGLGPKGRQEWERQNEEAKE